MAFSKGQKQQFTTRLMAWHRNENFRTLPWKEEKDPYKIWLSEIILQQTRAEQGLPYYLRFIESYPTVQDLAEAADEEVFRLWQGLGYYNRCKNLLGTARFISTDLDGNFPDSYAELLNLKGIGPYTAAAIASFGYGLPCAVVDGNVNRVLARYFGIEIPYDSTQGNKLFQSLAEELLDKTASAAYNQAIMDLGATVCTPANPRCGECPLNRDCFAFNHNLVGSLPVKTKKVVVRKRYFHYILFTTDNKLWIHKRTEKDIWQNLFQPFLIESDAPMDEKQILQHDVLDKLKISAKSLQPEGENLQKLTHQLIAAKCYSVVVKQPFDIPGKQGQWIGFEKLKIYPFPRTLVSFLEKKLYF
jgi:A/G-specific adenine glycosylase